MFSRGLLVVFGSSSLALLAGLVVCGACSSNAASGGQGLIVDNLGTCDVAYDASNGEYPLAALPTGQTCSAQTSCTLPVDTCAADFASGAVGSNLTIYECDCLDAGWSCYAATKVDTSCDEAGSAPSPDSGVDGSEAAPDAAPDSDASLDAGSADAADASSEDGSLDGGANDADVDGADQ